jgi:hypothetical protein
MNQHFITWTLREGRAGTGGSGGVLARRRGSATQRTGVVGIDVIDGQQFVNAGSCHAGEHST